MVSMDASAELKQLSLAKAEGYEDIRISGVRLDMDNDFKTWVGIIHAFAKHKVVGDTVTLPFVEFVRLCGIPTARSSAKLRKRTDSSLTRIATNTISFRSKGSDEYYVTHLVQTAKYSTKNDTVSLQADPKIFELYQFDKRFFCNSGQLTNSPEKNPRRRSTPSSKVCHLTRHQSRWLAYAPDLT